MGGGTSNLAQPTQRPFGISDNRVSTNEQSRPVPFVTGKNRVGVTFISDVFDPMTVAITQSMGKAGSQTTGYNYYGSFAVLICAGPVDTLFDLFLNGDTVYSNATALDALTLTQVGGVATFETANPHGLATGETVTIDGAFQPEYNVTAVITVTGPTTFTYAIEGDPASPATLEDNTWPIECQVHLDPLQRSDENPDFADFTIPNYGTARIYWGTETQMPDPYLNAKSGYQHPAYRGLCYMVFEQLWFGYQQTSVQNLEVVVGRYPRPGWWPGDGPAVNVQDDCNAIAAAVDWLQHPRSGLGLPDAALDTTGLLASAAQLETEGLGLSPVNNRAQDVSQTLTQLAEYFDGLPFITDDGKFSVALARPPADVGALPVVDQTMLTDKPHFTPADWTTVANFVELRFDDRILDYKENSVANPDSGAFGVTGQTDALTLQRPWVTRLDLAQQLAAAAGRVQAVPAISGTMTLRRIADLYGALEPGALFVFDYAPRHLENVVMRVSERSVKEPAAADFAVSFQVDRTYLYPVPSQMMMRGMATSLAVSVASRTMPRVAPLAALRVVELPAGLCMDGDPAVVVLGARQDPAQMGMVVYINTKLTHD